MDVHGDDLAGDTLVIGANQTSATATLNLSRHANASLDIAQFSTDQVTVNARGSDTLSVRTEFPSGLSLTVNLADHARLTGGFTMTFGSATLNGGAGSRFVNDGTSHFGGSSAIFDTDVRGTGTFDVSTAQSSAGNLEFGGSVSRGQTIDVRGDPGRGIASHIRIDQPDAFQGTANLNLFGEVDLQGLANADSYTFQNDMLSIYSGDTVVDTVRLTLPPPPIGQNFDLAVYQTATGVAIDRGAVPPGGTLLPVHV
ncbi:MAG TPA: hypothetical protein VJ779_02525 [Acetobacteraceae bacterium]|nr:hypothetical protein [Acetobacteraceae bacterium]